ncbi:preprotein translocase subunit YajC [Aeoliella sp. ICT_H6.2]|uniref:Sec translocon accessory complex subunit YajC n=1 Tax=Aeoliella straminimaris TaxID=2954799 RepID=A0A9X2FIP4_9BACT|nr:preprotein translocase subunit YajC [Aeoliella straminimaris]
MDWTTSLLLLAQEAGAQQAAAEADRPWYFDFIPMVLIALLAYFMLFLPEKKKQEQLKKLEGVKENDRVITTGGIYGVVTNIQRDAGRVTLRVDDATGTKIKVSLAAITQIQGDDNEGGKDKAKEKDK